MNNFIYQPLPLMQGLRSLILLQYTMTTTTLIVPVRSLRKMPLLPVIQSVYQLHCRNFLEVTPSRYTSCHQQSIGEFEMGCENLLCFTWHLGRHHYHEPLNLLSSQTTCYGKGDFRVNSAASANECSMRGLLQTPRGDIRCSSLEGEKSCPLCSWIGRLYSSRSFSLTQFSKNSQCSQSQTCL